MTEAQLRDFMTAIGNAYGDGLRDGAAAERDRIRHDLIDGDPGKLEVAFREFVDPEEAADCALAVADLLRGDES